MEQQTREAAARHSQETDIEKNAASDPDQSPIKTAEEERASFLVHFDVRDPENPKNFNKYFKAWMTFEMGLLAFAGSLGTAIITPAETDIARHFNVSQEVTIL